MSKTFLGALAYSASMGQEELDSGEVPLPSLPHWPTWLERDREQVLYEDDMDDESIPYEQRITKANNILPLWGNLHSMNLNHLVRPPLDPVLAALSEAVFGAGAGEHPAEPLLQEDRGPADVLGGGERDLVPGLPSGAVGAGYAADDGADGDVRRRPRRGGGRRREHRLLPPLPPLQARHHPQAARLPHQQHRGPLPPRHRIPLHSVWPPFCPSSGLSYPPLILLFQVLPAAANALGLVRVLSR